MNSVKKVCWNCVHCDTFGGVCFKGKFLNNADKPILLNAYTCDQFDDNVITKTMLEIEQLKAENEQLRQALLKCDPRHMDIGFACMFCGSALEHADNCDYIRLTRTKLP